MINSLFIQVRFIVEYRVINTWKNKKNTYTILMTVPSKRKFIVDLKKNWVPMRKVFFSKLRLNCNFVCVARWGFQQSNVLIRERIITWLLSVMRHKLSLILLFSIASIQVNRIPSMTSDKSKWNFEISLFHSSGLFHLIEINRCRTWKFAYIEPKFCTVTAPLASG